ncbi:adhesion G-protein coupled receptor G6-like [Amphiura filiformis]|uniref:adhesion G-protein coupled receptor G6-like n=1 Tax=Amphiura filiformis TaxID=82378 RepID=UPI003B225E62
MSCHYFNTTGLCDRYVCDASPHGTLYIPATLVGGHTNPGNVEASVTGECPWYTFNSDKPMVSGFCDGDYLSQPHFLHDSIICTCGRNLTVDEQLKKLAEIALTMDNVQSVLDNATSISERSQNISVDGVHSAIDIIVNAVDVQSPEPMVANGVIGVLNNVMDVNPEILEDIVYTNALNDATLALETQLQNVQVSEGDPYRNVRANLAAEVHEVSGSELQNGLGIVSAGAAAEALIDENIVLLDSQQLVDEFRPEADTLIFIPASVFDTAKDTESEMIRVTFAFFSTPVLFKSVSLAESNSNNQDYQRDINTRVLSCTVGGIRIINLEEPIRTVFQRVSSDYFNTANNSACVYWDYEADSGRGNWSTEGCRTIGEIQNGRQECECDHLTNFAVLMVRPLLVAK